MFFICEFVKQRGVAIACAAAFGWPKRYVCVFRVCVCVVRVANDVMCAAIVYSDIIAYGLMV